MELQSLKIVSFNKLKLALMIEEIFSTVSYKLTWISIFVLCGQVTGKGQTTNPEAMSESWACAVFSLVTCYYAVERSSVATYSFHCPGLCAAGFSCSQDAPGRGDCRVQFLLLAQARQCRIPLQVGHGYAKPKCEKKTLEKINCLFVYRLT